MKAAVIVVDLQNDFVTGKFGSEQAVEISKKTEKFLDSLGNKAEVIFTLDNHIPDDPEFKVWGEHCVMGTWGSKQIENLLNKPGYRITERHYDGFYDTDLDGYLRAKGIDTLYITGISTDICVLHTAGGAFSRYYNINVISDLCAAIDPERHSEAISYMERNYGVRTITMEDALGEI